MAKVNVVGTNHTSFTVKSLDRALALFVDGLGFELLSRGPRDPGAIERITGVSGGDVTIAFVQGPAHRIEFVEYHAPAERGHALPRACDAGFSHIALDIDDMDAALDLAGGHDLALMGEVYAIDQGPNAGRRVAYFRDDNGLTIEFLEAK